MSAFVNTPVGPMLQRFSDAFIGLAIWLFISMAAAAKPKGAFGFDDASWLCAPLLLAALCIRHERDGKLSHARSDRDDLAAFAMCLLGVAFGLTWPLLNTPYFAAFILASSTLAYLLAKLSRRWGMDDMAQAMLWKACRGNQPHQALRALSLGACPMSENTRGISPLEHCCQSGKTDLATLMLGAFGESPTHANAIQNALATAIDAKQTHLATLLQGRLPDSWTPPSNRRWRQTIDSIRWRDPSWLKDWMAQLHARNEKAKIVQDLASHDSPAPQKKHRNSL